MQTRQTAFGNSLDVRKAPLSDLLEVLSKPPQDFFPLTIAHLLPEFLQSEMHDVVVMQLLRRDFATEFQPEAVQEVDFLGGEVRRVRAEK